MGTGLLESACALCNARHAGVAELADARDLKSCEGHPSSGFEARPRQVEAGTDRQQSAADADIPRRNKTAAAESVSVCPPNR